MRFMLLQARSKRPTIKQICDHNQMPVCVWEEGASKRSGEWYIDRSDINEPMSHVNAPYGLNFLGDKSQENLRIDEAGHWTIDLYQFPLLYLEGSRRSLSRFVVLLFSFTCNNLLPRRVSSKGFLSPSFFFSFSFSFSIKRVRYNWMIPHGENEFSSYDDFKRSSSQTRRLTLDDAGKREGSATDVNFTRS